MALTVNPSNSYKRKTVQIQYSPLHPPANAGSNVVVTGTERSVWTNDVFHALLHEGIHAQLMELLGTGIVYPNALITEILEELTDRLTSQIEAQVHEQFGETTPYFNKPVARTGYSPIISRGNVILSVL